MEKQSLHTTGILLTNFLGIAYINNITPQIMITIIIAALTIINTGISIFRQIRDIFRKK